MISSLTRSSSLAKRRRSSGLLLEINTKIVKIKICWLLAKLNNLSTNCSIYLKEPSSKIVLIIWTSTCRSKEAGRIWRWCRADHQSRFRLFMMKGLLISLTSVIWKRSRYAMTMTIMIKKSILSRSTSQANLKPISINMRTYQLINTTSSMKLWPSATKTITNYSIMSTYLWISKYSSTRTRINSKYFWKAISVRTSCMNW